MKKILFLNQENTFFDVGVIDIKEYIKYHELPLSYEWVKSIIVFTFGHINKTHKAKDYISAKFAYGDDYHLVLKSYLENLILTEEQVLKSKYEIKIDVNPFFEKTCAYLAGLGTFGKNNLIISPRFGTFMYIATILTDLEFEEYSVALDIDQCGGCNLCILACPTKALDDGFNRPRCISYLTQYKSQDYQLYDKIKKIFVGCDYCQDICPHNRNKEYPILPEFNLNELSLLDLKKFEKFAKNNFKQYYQNKTFNWIGNLKMLRNILVLEVNNKNITKEQLEFYQKKFKNVLWFTNHIDYLKEKIK